MISFLRKNIYKFHRSISILALIPVLIWTSSGLMHPFMTWFKPQQPKSVVIPKAVDQSKIKIGMDSVLKINQIDKIKQIRLVQFKGKVFYQIKLPNQTELQYFDTQTAEKWQNGDQIYAEHLARYFFGDSTSQIASNQIVSEFTHEYKSVYKLLPVYEVRFARPDNARVYVETEMSRLGTIIDDRRATFTWIFNNLHNWEFINFNDTFRIVFLIFVMSICFTSALTGSLVYGFFYKKLNPNAVPTRKFHRNLGITVSVAMLAFAFSGAFHAFQKLSPDDRNKFVYEPEILANELPNLEKMQAIFEQYNPKKDFSNLFLGKMDREILLNLTHVDGKKPNPIHTDFVQISNLKNLDGGCMTYANFLANRFFADKYGKPNDPNCCEDQASAKPSETEKKLPKIVKNDYVNEFFREYGFFNKRLPVVKVQYETSGDKRLYIEFATGKLAASVENSQAWEGLSFAYFHKYHLFEFLGKTPRDLIMMAFALGNLLVAVLGLRMFIARKIK